MKPIIALLPGDGVGPEVVAPAADLLKSIAPLLDLHLEFKEALIGGAAIDKAGLPLPAETFRLAKESAAVILGTVGGPAWDDLDVDRRPEHALLTLRQGLGLYANLRPVRTYRSLAGTSPLKDMSVEDIDLLVVRELTGGVYFGEPRGYVEDKGMRTSFNTMVYNEEQVRRIAKVAFEAARQRRRQVTSVDKANVLETSRLWRQVVTEEGNRCPDIILKHMYVDNCAMQLIIKPLQFDVILTSNLFGDILSDEAAVLGGSIGVLPSASLGFGVSLYEPIHGSTPEIAGQDKANPIAAILSVALMLRHTFKIEKAAQAIETAVSGVLDDGYATADIWREGLTLVGTVRMGTLITERTKVSLAESKP